MHRKRLRLALACALVALVVAVPAAMGGAASGASVTAAEAEGTGLWFVELKGTPAKFRADARAANVNYTERFAFTRLWNGVSVKAGAAAMKELRSLDTVKAVYPVYTAELAPTSVASPEMATAIAMTGADKAKSELGYTGAGVKVAVMDTGIDYDHADLGGDGVTRTNSTVFPTSRVTHGWDFVGDAFDANPNNATYNPNPVPDPYPDDCNGHGTHVAGIVGANAASPSGVTGVAPEVTFGAYRVFGCTGSTTADIMIAAMERALADGMDILNMSIGSAFQTWPQYPTGAAASKLVDEGMVVVASIGNSGANGVYSAGSPGVGDKVIGVASFDNSHVALASFTISPDDTRIGYGNAAAAPTAPTSGSLPMARTGTTTTADDACTGSATQPAPGSLTGQAVLIRRGTCAFHEKALNAQNAGAAAVVLYNNTAGRFSPTVAGTPPITIPVVAISDTEGALIDSRLQAGPVTLTWSDETLNSVNPTGGLISSFSSYGLGAELDLKPDIGAPGGLIRAPYPLESGAYATISGTSMSAPHVAGAAALLKQAKPSLAAGDFRTVLQNSAEPKAWWGNPGLGFLDNVHRQGAGMLQIDRSILATTTVTPGKWPVNHLNPHVAEASRTFTLANAGSEAVTYDVSYVNALSTGGHTFAAPGFFLGNASVAFSAPTVTVPAGGQASVTANLTAATSPALGQYGGYIVFTPQGGGTPLRVPYAGFIGNYLDLPVLGQDAHGFPWLAKLDGGFFFNQPDGATYTLQNGDVPYFLVNLAHQARMVRAEILNAGNGRPVHPVFNVAFQEEFLPRNSAAAGAFFAWSWNGTRIHSNGRGGPAAELKKVVPNGTYIVRLSVLKALGNPGNPAHWETWTSPSITIARP
jgi:minor extracellular serine protease Vpr